MKELQLERQLRVAPEGAVRPEADVAVLVIVEVEQLLRQAAVGQALRRCRERAGARDDIVEAESLLLRARDARYQRQREREPPHLAGGTTLIRGGKWVHEPAW